MKFILWSRREGMQPTRNEEGRIISDGIIGRVTEDNAYLRAYPEYPDERRPWDLPVGFCIEEVKYSLSGSKGTYDIWRVE